MNRCRFYQMHWDVLRWSYGFHYFNLLMCCSSLLSTFPHPRTFAAKLKMMADIALMMVWVMKSTLFPQLSPTRALQLFLLMIKFLKKISRACNSVAGFTSWVSRDAFPPDRWWNSGHCQGIRSLALIISFRSPLSHVITW